MQIDYAFIRDATNVELEQIVALYKAGGWWRENPEAWATLPALIKGSLCFLVARQGDRLVGMGRVISDGVSDGYIQDVVVLEELRGRGIGAELVQRLGRRCRERGLVWVALVAEPGTRPFYERLGFSLLGAGYEPMFYGKRPE